MKKQILAAGLALCLCAGLFCGCTAQPNSAAQSAQTQSGADQASQTASLVPEMESQLLFEQDGLAVTAQGLVEDTIFGPCVQLLLENNSDQDLLLQCDFVVVNGYMFNSVPLSTQVNAGKKANDTLILDSSLLQVCGIEQIADLSAQFRVVSADSYQTIYTTDELAMTTAASGTVKQPPLTHGQELYNQNGLRITALSVEEDTLMGCGVWLFLENTADQDLTVSCESMSVNGFMVQPVLSCRVNSGRMAADAIYILSSELEQNAIETIQDVELNLTAYDPETYMTVLETGPLTFAASAL